jgi:tetratricopeptide (TPR) repeat protein
MRRAVLCALCASVFLAVAGGALASGGRSLSSTFAEGNTAFWAGDFAKAAKTYAALEELGVRSKELVYNRATAEARLGNLGRAVQYYERVLRLEPGDEDAVHNLAVIRDYLARRASEAGRNADLAPATTAWRALLDRFTPRSAAFAFLLFHLALFGTLVARRFVRAEGARLTLGVSVGVLALLAVATAAIAVGKWRQATREIEAIVVRANAMDVAEGPGSTVKRFALDEGSRVLVLEKREGFVKIRDDEGRDGWAMAEDLGEI